MQGIRHLLAQRQIAMLLCMAALLLKLLVPAGYMIGGESGRITIELCSGVASQRVMLAMPGMQHSMPDHGTSKDHGKAEMPCAFSGLSATSLGAIDLVQLATLLAFVMAAGVAGIMVPAPFKPAFLRPPSQGPPAKL